MISGACMPHWSLNWYHRKVVEVGKIEIKKEIAHQNKCTGLGLVAYGIENESESIDTKLVEIFKDN